MDIIETAQNPNGICSMSYGKGNCCIALPDKPQGSVLLKVYGEQMPTSSTVKAHKKPITTLALNDDGTLLATASAKV